MKKFLFPLIFFIPLNIFSQLANTTYLIPSAGLSIPVNINGYSASYNAGIALEFALTNVTVLGFEANYANNSSSLVKYKGPTVWQRETMLDNGNYSTTGFLGYMKFQDASKINTGIQMYLKFGAGLSVISRKGMRLIYTSGFRDFPDEHSNGFLFAPSLGVNFMADTKNKIVVEAQYRINRSSSQDAQMFLVNIGYAFRL